ncbi:MAG: BspA family leucine-rich repeat surface protein [Firmicutes bacterium]|nr:BspA family leucine-rich repeat surface protein [Bacillota bacterium]
MKHNFVSKLVKAAVVPVFLAALAFLPQNSITDGLTNNVNAFASEILADYGFATIYSDDNNDLILDLTGELPMVLIDSNTERISSSFYGKYVSKITSTSGATLPVDCTNYFLGFEYCKTIDLSNVNALNVKYAIGMFDGCKALEEIDMTPFANTHFLAMSDMFQDCSSLKSIDLSCIEDMSNVTAIDDMFFNCTSLKSVNMSSLNSSKINEVDGIFWGCTKLKSVNIANLNFNPSDLSDESGEPYEPTHIFMSCDNLENVIMSDPDFLDHIFLNNLNKNTVYIYTDKSIAEAYADPEDTRFKFVTTTAETEKNIDSTSSTKSYRTYCFDKNGDVYLIYHTKDLSPASVEVRYAGTETAGGYKQNDVLKPADTTIAAAPFTKVYKSIKFEDGSVLEPSVQGEYLYAIKLNGANILKPVNIDFYEKASSGGGDAPEGAN